MNILLSCFFMFLSLIAHADENMHINVNTNEPSFVVSLEANPTTGFEWSVLDFDKNLLTLDNINYQKQQTTLIGSGGKMIFTFILNRGKSYPKETNIQFKYARSWEQREGLVKNVMVHFISTTL